MEAKKEAIDSLAQSKCLHDSETSALGPHKARCSPHHLDSLLQALTALKKNKESQYSLLQDFQERLAALESSMTASLAGEGSLKV